MPSLDITPRGTLFRRNRRIRQKDQGKSRRPLSGTYWKGRYERASRWTRWPRRRTRKNTEEDRIIVINNFTPRRFPAIFQQFRFNFCYNIARNSRLARHRNTIHLHAMRTIRTWIRWIRFSETRTLEYGELTMCECGTSCNSIYRMKKGNFRRCT